MKYSAFVLLVLALAEGLLLGCGHSWGGNQRCTYKGSWSQSDTYQLDSTKNSGVVGGVLDTDGSLFVTGYGVDAGGLFHTITRKLAMGTNSWFTVDDYTYPSGGGINIGNRTALTPNGGLISTSSSNDGLASYHCILRASNDHGVSWRTVNDIQFFSGKNTSCTNPIINSVGDLLLSVTYSDAGGGAHWAVMRSRDNGANFSVIDDYQYPGGSSTGINGMAVDSNNTLYAAGNAIDGTGFYRGILRVSRDAGSSWSTALDFQYASGHNTFFDGTGVIVTRDNSIYVNVEGRDSSNLRHFIILKSIDQARTWSTIDDYSNGSYGAYAYSMWPGMDSNNSIFVAGVYFDSGAHLNGLVRTNVSGSFVNSDIYELALNQFTQFISVMNDSQGNLYVIGQANNAGGLTNWVIRKLDCGL